MYTENIFIGLEPGLNDSQFRWFNNGVETKVHRIVRFAFDIYTLGRKYI